MASSFGWLLRTLEADSDAEQVPRAWHQFAFRSYIALQWLDGRLSSRGCRRPLLQPPALRSKTRLTL